MKLLTVAVTAVLTLSLPAMAQSAKKEAGKARVSKDEKCCLDAGGRWNGSTTPGLCYGLGRGAAAIYGQCTGRLTR